MAVTQTTIYQLPTASPSSVGTLPNFKFMVCGNTLIEITTAGYLNQIDLQSNPVSSTDILQILYNYNPQTSTGDYGAFTVSLDNGIITLHAAVDPGLIILPVTDGHFANFIGTLGAIGDLGFHPSNAALHVVPMLDPTSVPIVGYLPAFRDTNGTIGRLPNGSGYLINGDFYAGGGGIPGRLISNPPLASRGVLTLQAVNNASGDFPSIINNSTSITQQTNYHLADPSAVNATIGVFPANVVAGHALVAGTNPGTIADGGIPNSGAVLLTPPGSADQTITDGQLILSRGSLILGRTSFNSGLLQLMNGIGAGAFTFNNSLSGASANFSVSILPPVTLGQTSTYRLPDPGSATATFNVTATTLTPGHILVAGTTNGVTVDSGVTVAQLELVSNIKAAKTADIGGGGAGPFTISVPGMTAASIVVATIDDSSNVVSVAKAAAALNGFNIVFDADPGASCIVNYTVFISPQ